MVRINSRLIGSSAPAAKPTATRASFHPPRHQLPGRHQGQPPSLQRRQRPASSPTALISVDFIRSSIPLPCFSHVHIVSRTLALALWSASAKLHRARAVHLAPRTGFAVSLQVLVQRHLPDRAARHLVPRAQRLRTSTTISTTISTTVRPTSSRNTRSLRSGTSQLPAERSAAIA